MMFRPTRRLALAALVVAGVCLAATIPSLALSGQMRSKVVNLTFWSWVPNLQDNEVNLWNSTHPDIQVSVTNVGQAMPEYTKLTTALKAGSGAPDLVQIEFQYLPTYVTLKGLVDLSKYGASAVKNDFVPWTWAQVSSGSHVWAIPQDSGPLGLLYRKDIFDKYGLKVPTTWSQYAADAYDLHNRNPKIYLADFGLADAGEQVGLFWQAGSRPFKVSGTTVTIRIDDAPALQVANYWGRLIYSHAIAAQPAWTTAWYTALSKGTYATMTPAAAWAPVFLQGLAKSTSGKWRAAPIPQWTTGGTPVNGNWGGSTTAVTVQSQHPSEAAQFAIWLNTNLQSASMFALKQYLFPTLKAVLNSSSFKNAKFAFYGGQQVNKLFATASTQVDTHFQWSPFQTYVYSQLQAQFALAAQGKESFAAALHKTQKSVVAYAKSQGFTVK
jgi:multiple sugar transport system substrate-binding protein